MKLSEIIGMSARQIRTLGDAVKKALYTNLRRSVSMRGKAFQRKGLEQRMPKAVKNLPPFKDATQKQINDALSMAETYLTGKIYESSGYADYLAEQRAMWGDRLGFGRSLTPEEHDIFGNFMNDAGKRMGNNFGLVSSQAAELVKEAFRLNLKPDQFLRNLEYWTDHIKQLKEAEPISRTSAVKPSDYVKQLKLESVTSWNKKHEDEIAANRQSGREARRKKKKK